MSSSIELGYPLPKTNSAGGVSVSQSYFNASGKTMKYITFTYIPYNSVKDMVYCTISKKAKVSGKLTGPVRPNAYGFVEWDNLWYNPTITKVLVDEVTVEYMDGTIETIIGEDIVNLRSDDSVYKKMKDEENREIEEKHKEEIALKKALKEKKTALKRAYKFFMVFACLSKLKDDEEMKFHANQGLSLFILEILSIILGIIIPYVGVAITIVMLIVAIFFSYMCCTAIDNDKRCEIPLISKIKYFK